VHRGAGLTMVERRVERDGLGRGRFFKEYDVERKAERQFR